MEDIRAKEYIANFYSEKKRMPSFREIATLVGLRSTNAVSKLVTRMEAKGWITRDKEGRLIQTQLSGSLRVLGLVEAGFPSPAEEELQDTMSLDDYLIPRKEASYLLRVKGDSMEGAGIIDGDLVIVERGKEPRLGQIVIAEVDGGWTMKYLRTKNGQFYLEAANPKYKDIHPEGALSIEAIVTGVIRKYGNGK